ncbi:substrate-binding domain-containing protein [Demequina aestuarii]|uniref:substrate-binding domain-containing protein n=1 Tax=Demequina aestuarii TaxID=327095 RepID=UPI0007840DF4|nr:sugar-binding protein [Demequina aestuarii]
MRVNMRGAAALAAFGVIALAGCSSDRGGETEADPASTSTAGAAGGEICIEEGAAIGVALPQKTSENWVLAEQLFNEGLTEAGFEPIVQFGNSGVTEQQNQIAAMIEQDAQVIVVGAIDGSQLGTQLERAKETGASVIAYDRLVLNTEAVDAYIAFDNFRVGVLQGEALLQGLAERKGEGPYNIELIAGSSDDANSTPFFEGAMSVLQPKIDDGTLTVVSGQTSFEQAATAGWQAQNAQTRMDTIMSGSYSGDTELHGILSPNDTLARAALTSVDQAGKDTPVITGQDSEVESVKSIVDGEQYSTIYKDTRELVAQTIASVEELAACGEIPVNDTEQYDNGVKVVPAFLLDPKIVTQENAAEVYADDATLGPLTEG